MKEKRNDISKPSEVLELEKAYKCIIRNSDQEYGFGGKFVGNSYSVNEKEEVVALSIFERSVVDVKPISSLKNLEYLSLSRNRIEDISQVAKLTKLKHVFVGGNKIKDVSPLLELSELQSVAIWENPINNIEILRTIRKLEGFYFQNCNVSSLSFVFELVNLKQLYASSNKIFDLSPLSNLQALNTLLLDRNLIRDISSILNLTNLKQLNVSQNFIRSIPSELAKKFYWLSNSLEEAISENEEVLSIQNNPLEFPPKSVIELGSETVQDYYHTTKEFGYEPLSEGRVIVIGDGSAGKSSLIERVLNNTFDIGKVQTNGIKIDNWHLQHQDQRKLTFHIWDFGGQEIQHAVHKFFFTDGCLYILVLDNRKEEEPEYWLQQIDSLGGGAPVLVVFNKQDDNTVEIADRKFLKEKYKNIIGFYNTSCKTSAGIDEFRNDLQTEVVKLQTVEERFPNNWFEIKKTIESCTSGAQHYLDFERYGQICNDNNASSEKTQKLLLKYFTTIGAVTWFGDTYLNFLHVLSPAWITQGVYKIVTAKKTAALFGRIHIDDFKELLHPSSSNDYTYEENHYGYILSMMKKFDLCYTPDDRNLLIPSAFGKVPKVEYSDFRGDHVRTYILQFRDYMPTALIHRFITKKLPEAFDNNYWYSGIVVIDGVTNSLAMVQADKEAKRLYVRIKGGNQLGIWEHIRRELQLIASNYANINYNELVALDESSENTVNYGDLISHIKAQKPLYFHPKLQKDFNVGYLMGLFESRDQTLKKFEDNEVLALDRDGMVALPQNLVIQILNNNSPVLNNQLNTQINIDIDIQIVNNIGSAVKGEAEYLLDALGDKDDALTKALKKIVQFAEDSKSATNSGDVISKGWGRKLKGILQSIGGAGEQFKNIHEGADSVRSMFSGIEKLANQFNLKEIIELISQVNI
jgi:internalin A